MPKRRSLIGRLMRLAAILLILVIGGEALLLRSLRGGMERAAEAVVATYRDIGDRYLTPLEQRADLALIEQEGIAKIREEERHADTTSLQATLVSVANMQAAYQRLFARDTPTLGGEPAFAVLRTAVDRHGEVRSSIDAYNSAALKWKGHVTMLGSIAQSLHLTPMPLLGFDGALETTTTISL